MGCSTYIILQSLKCIIISQHVIENLPINAKLYPCYAHFKELRDFGNLYFVFVVKLMTF